MPRMTPAEAGARLRAMHEGAPHGEQRAHLILFGIMYPDVVNVLAAAAIVRESGIGDSYGQEVNYGRTLAVYVTLRTAR